MIPTESKEGQAIAQPLVHAIVPTQRGARWLGDCLRALLGQETAARLLLCVVDNGSSDGTAALLAGFPSVQHLRSEANLGYGRANNLALRRALRAGADFALLVNDDVVLAPGYLAALLSAAAAQPASGLFTGLLLLQGERAVDSRVGSRNAAAADARVNSTGLSIDAVGRASDRDFRLPLGELRRADGPVAGVSGGAALVRTALLRQIGLFDPDYFAYYEDVDLSLRARRAGIGCWYCSAAVGRHRFGASFGPGSAEQRYLLGRNHLRTLALHQPLARAALLVPATAAWRALVKAPLELLRGRPALALAELRASVGGALAAAAALPQRLRGGVPRGAEPEAPEEPEERTTDPRKGP